MDRYLQVMVVFSNRNAEELFQSSSAPTAAPNFNKKARAIPALSARNVSSMSNSTGNLPPVSTAI